jgi:hypothetical protein
METMQKHHKNSNKNPNKPGSKVSLHQETETKRITIETTAQVR